MRERRIQAWGERPWYGRESDRASERTNERRTREKGTRRIRRSMGSLKNQTNKQNPKAPISLQCTKEATNGVSLSVSLRLNFWGNPCLLRNWKYSRGRKRLHKWRGKLTLMNFKNKREKKNNNNDNNEKQTNKQANKKESLSSLVLHCTSLYWFVLQRSLYSYRDATGRSTSSIYRVKIDRFSVANLKNYYQNGRYLKNNSI